MIGPDIRITVLNTNGKRVQLGIQAPDEIRVLRGELVQPEIESSGITESGESQDRGCDKQSVASTSLSA